MRLNSDGKLEALKPHAWLELREIFSRKHGRFCPRISPVAVKVKQLA
jgi:hypothetical protein